MKKVLLKFRKIDWKTPVPEPLFNKVAGLRYLTLLKKRLWHRCFPVNFCEISKNTVFNRIPLVAASVENAALLFAAVS